MERGRVSPGAAPASSPERPTAGAIRPEGGRPDRQTPARSRQRAASRPPPVSVPRSPVISAGPPPHPRGTPPTALTGFFTPIRGSEPHRHNRHHSRHAGSVAWVPDSLAERCYHCRAAFTVLLRRHHCRRCGNVFCDGCSSARIPLVSAGFLTPVRVCQKCCVAARKAHAKMVEERQRRRLLSDGAAPPGISRSGAPRSNHRLRSASSSSSLGGGERAADRNAAAMAVASGMYFHQPFVRGRHAAEDDATHATDHHRHHHHHSREVAEGRSLHDDYGETRPFYDGSSEDPSGESSDGGGSGANKLHTLPGEVVLVRSDQVRARLLNRIEHNGTLYVTTYRVVFSPAMDDSSMLDDASMDAVDRVREDELPFASDQRNEPLTTYQAIPLMTIDRAKRKEIVETDSGVIDLVCKDFRRIQFVFDGLVSKQTFGSFDRTYHLIRQYALGDPDGRVDYFAKYWVERFEDARVDGWQVYDAVEEFERMGVSSSSHWRISDSNKSYELCATYPAVLAVPASVSDTVLHAAAKFRSKGRIPVLSWRDRQTGAVICRSSQPLVGLGQKQCDKDVFLIQAIAAANPSSSKMVIIDARPWKNAVAQKTVGRAGYELTEQYETRHTTASLKYADMVASEQQALALAAAANGKSEPSTPTVASPDTNSANGSAVSPDTQQTESIDAMNDRKASNFLGSIDASLVLTECKLIFMGIENIHTMRKSYNRLTELCTAKASNDKWLEQLASTHWIDHVSRILDSAVEIVRIVKEQKSSVLVHCSDGWDRTAQLTALTMLMIDPYYRTIHGFQVLVEKEWCSFGHKFRDRTGHGPSNGSSEISPVFLQWIDCVWQLLVQFPSAFEFNERYLMLVIDHLYSCRFGTFLYDSERERVVEEARRPTNSLWTYLSTKNPAMVANPFYYSHDAPRRKWKASVTATRQCFELPPKDDYLSRIPVMTLDEFEVRSLVERRHNMRDIGTMILPNNTPPSYSSLDDVSTIAVASSASFPRAGNNDFDEYVGDLHASFLSEFDDVPPGIRDMDAASSSSDDASESDFVGDLPLCHYKLVRDLDAGFAFPQAIDPSSLAMFSSPPPMAPRSFPLSSPRRRNSEPPASAPRAGTSPTLASLTSLFKPMMDRSPLSSDGQWNASDADAVSESDCASRIGALIVLDDVIVPSCSVKALRFWTRYYLRWNPAMTPDRDPGIEVETIYRDLLRRHELLQSGMTKLRRDRLTRKADLDQRVGMGDEELSLVGGSAEVRRDAVEDRGIPIPGARPPLDRPAPTLEDRIAFLQEERRRRIEMVEKAFDNQIAELLQQGRGASTSAPRRPS